MDRKNIIEQIKRSFYGGVPSIDHDLSDNEVNLFLNQAIAQLATASMREGIEIDGVETIQGGFYITLKGLNVSSDTFTGLYLINLPSVPVGIKRGHGVSSVFFPSNQGVSLTPMEVSPREVEYMDMLPLPKKKIFWWVENSQIMMKSSVNLVNKQAMVRLVGTGGGINDPLNVPSDMLGQAVTIVLGMLRERKGTPEDNVNDGIDNA